MTAVRIADWLDALEAELAALATGMLGFASFEALGRAAEPPPRAEGAYVGLIASGAAYQIGVAAQGPECEALARGLLGPDVAAPSAADVADAVCEIVNILAGGVKRRIAAIGGEQLGLGLPTYFHGPVQATERLGVAAATVRVGDVRAALLLIHPRALAQEA